MSYGGQSNNNSNTAHHTSAFNALASSRQASEERWLRARSLLSPLPPQQQQQHEQSPEESLVVAQRRRTEEARLEMERSYAALKQARSQVWGTHSTSAFASPSLNGGERERRWGQASIEATPSSTLTTAITAHGEEEEGEWKSPPRRSAQAATPFDNPDDTFSSSRKRILRSPSPAQASTRAPALRTPPSPAQPSRASEPAQQVLGPKSERSAPPPPTALPWQFSSLQQQLRVTQTRLGSVTAQFTSLSTRLDSLEASEKQAKTQNKALVKRTKQLEAEIEALRKASLTRFEETEKRVEGIEESAKVFTTRVDRRFEGLAAKTAANQQQVEEQKRLRLSQVARERDEQQLWAPPFQQLPPLQQQHTDDLSEHYAYGRSPPPAAAQRSVVAPPPPPPAPVAAEEPSSARLEEELRARLLSLRRTRASEGVASPLAATFAAATATQEAEATQREAREHVEADTSLEDLKRRVKESRKAKVEPLEEVGSHHHQQQQYRQRQGNDAGYGAGQAQGDSVEAAAAKQEERHHPPLEPEDVKPFLVSTPPPENDDAAAAAAVEDPLEALRRRAAASRRAKAAQEAAADHGSEAVPAASLVGEQEQSEMLATPPLEAKRTHTHSPDSVASGPASPLRTWGPPPPLPKAGTAGEGSVSATGAVVRPPAPSAAATAPAAPPASSAAARAVGKDKKLLGKVAWGMPVGLQETPLVGGEQFIPLVLAIRQLCGWPGFIARAAQEPLKIARVHVVLLTIKPTILQAYNNDLSYFIQKAQAFVAIELELSRAKAHREEFLRGAAINLRDVHRPYHTHEVYAVPTLKAQIKQLCVRAHLNHEEYLSGQVSWTDAHMPLRVAFSDETFPFPFNLASEWADAIGRAEFFFPFVDALRLHPDGASTQTLEEQLRQWLGQPVMSDVLAGLGSFHRYVGAALLHVTLDYCSDIHVERIKLPSENLMRPFKTFEANQLYFATAVERRAVIHAGAANVTAASVSALASAAPAPAPRPARQLPNSVPGLASFAAHSSNGTNVHVHAQASNAAPTAAQQPPYAWNPNVGYDPNAPRVPIPGFPGL